MLKEKLYYLFETNSHSLFSSAFHIAFILLIILNVISVITETVESIELKYHDLFYYFECFSVAIFTLEYLIRIWVCDINQKYQGRFGRIRFLLSPMAIVDLISIAPFYLPVLTQFDLRTLRALRLLRIFRLFKLGRYSEAYAIMVRVIEEKFEYLILSIVFVLTLLVITSSLMYFIESEAQPDNFSSIPATMWWGIVTLTTVGYGDVFPITPLGKVLGGILAIFGIGLFALPASILASGFTEAINHKPIKTCPHCGHELKDV